MTKCNFYRQCIESLNVEMTLTGQESRILTLYYFPNHPQIELFSQLCERYKQHSSKVKENERKRILQLNQNMMTQQKLDEEFAERLRKFDQVDED